MKKIVLFGAQGTIGTAVTQALKAAGHEVVTVGRKSGDFQADFTNRESLRKVFAKIGSFDAVASAAGDVSFAPLEKLGPEQWTHSLGNKLMGQIHMVQEALPFIRDGGSFTLVSGILSDEPIMAGAAASVANRGIEGFAMAAAIELPRGVRINVVSPTLLKESEGTYGPFFAGFIPVEGRNVAEAYRKSILGAQTGQVYRVI